MNPNTLLTATQAATLIPRITRHTLGMWQTRGKIQPTAYKGRSPLYQWGDLLRVEHATRPPIPRPPAPPD